MADVLTITPENLETVIAGDRIVLIDAWAAWCGPCRGFAPVFEKAAGERPEHLFAKLDTEAHKDLVAKLNIVNIPTLIIYREGILLYHEAGSPAADVLADLIAQVEGLDMDMVRREMAADAAREAEAGESG